MNHEEANGAGVSGDAQPDRKPSKAALRLSAAHEAWVAKGSPEPTKKDVAPVIKAYEQATKDVEAAEGNLAKARAHLSATVERLVRLTGRGRVDLGGKLGVVIPMSRGESTLFLRPESVKPARKLG